MYDVVIIGAGLGGLECGALLAQRGRKVLVVERERTIGGCLQSFGRKNATAFDTGFHYVGGIGEGQSLHEAFASLQLLDLPWHRLNLEGFEKISIGSKSYTFDQGFDNFAKSLSLHFPNEREGIRRYADLLRRVAEAKGEMATQLNEKLMGISAWKYLVGNFKDPLLIDVLSGASMKMELRRSTLPLFTFAHVNSSAIEGSWRIVGGGHQIANRLADVIKSNGGEIVTSSRVIELIEENGRITKAWCATGKKYEAGVFISDLHPTTTCRLVRHPQKMRKSYIYRMDNLENTFGMLTVQLHLRPGYMPYLNYNHYIYRNPDVWSLHENNDPVGGIMISSYVPTDGSLYTKQIDLLTPVPLDKFKQWEKTKIGRRGEDYYALKEKIASRCIDIAEDFYPDLRKSSRAIVSSPLTWQTFTHTPQGTAYGARKSYNDPLSNVMSPRTPLPNLFLTGQSVAVHGVHGVTQTAFETVKYVENYG